MNLRRTTERFRFLHEYLDLAEATGVEDARWEEFQSAHLCDEGTFRIEAKSRQIAWSWLAGAEGMADAILDGRDSIFVSINMEEAKEKIRYARQVYESIREVRLPKLVKDSAFGLELSNGARLTSMPARPPRGRARSNVYLDEFAHVMFDVAIYTAALPIISKGGRLRIGSSTFGASGRFWEVFEQKIRPYPGYLRKLTPWWEVYAFCTNVPEARVLAPLMLTEHRVELFGNHRIKAILANLPEEDFQQEYECHLPQTEVMMADGSTKKFINLDIGDELVYNNANELSVCKVLDFRRIGMREIIKITTEAGTTLSVSTGHKVKTRNGKESIDTAVEVGYVFGTPNKQDKELALARLVGYNLGDGTIAVRTGRYTKKSGEVKVYPPYYQASYYSATKEDLETLADDMVLAGITEKRPSVLFKKGSRPEYDAYQIHVSYAAAQRLVDAGCVAGKKTEQDFSVPEWVLNGSKEVQVEFLAALFGAEGNTPREPSQSKQRGKLPQTLYVKMLRGVDGCAFLEQVNSMLNGLGISTALTHGKEGNRTSCTITVHTTLENALLFFDTVGYRHAKRKQEMAFLWKHYLRAYRHEGVMRKAEIEALHKNGLSYAKIGKELGMSAQGAYNILNKERHNSSWKFPLFSEWVQPRYEGNTLYLKIVGKEYSGGDDVYNITVDSPDHSYLLADGLDNFNCIFVDETAAWITWEEIKAAQDVDLLCHMVEAKQTLKPEIEEAIDKLAKERVHGKVEETFAVGVDIGRTRNTTEIYVIGKSTTNTYPLRLAISLDAMEFSDQELVLASVLRKLPITKMYIDRNGIGRNLAENMTKRHGSRVEGVDFTTGTKTLWATDAKTLIQQHKTPLPVDRDLAYQIHSIKKIVTGGKNLVFDTDANEKHHADRFWAWALGLSAVGAGNTGKRTAGALG